MITKVHSPAKFEKITKKSPQYNRALAESGVIDAFIAENDRIFYPLHAEQQWRDYESKKRASRRPGRVGVASEQPRSE